MKIQVVCMVDQTLDPSVHYIYARLWTKSIVSKQRDEKPHQDGLSHHMLDHKTQVEVDEVIDVVINYNDK